MSSIKVLFVCMGNICRSPTAEGVFRRLVVQARLDHLIQIDSAGTHAYHLGNPPDVRSQRAAHARGIDISRLRARRIEQADFDRFDHILVMDAQNYIDVVALSPSARHREKVQLLLDFAHHVEEREVPDPYYGGTHGFDLVLDLIEDAAHGLLNHLRQNRMRDVSGT